MTEVQCRIFINFLRSWQTFADGLLVLDSSRLYATSNFDVVARETCCVGGFCASASWDFSPRGVVFFDMWPSLTALSTCQKDTVRQASPLIRLETPRLQSGHPRAFTWKLSSWMSIKLRPSSFIKHQVPRVETTSWFNMIQRNYYGIL